MSRDFSLDLPSIPAYRRPIARAALEAIEARDKAVRETVRAEALFQALRLRAMHPVLRDVRNVREAI